jgi:hypothetical protein
VADSDTSVDTLSKSSHPTSTIALYVVSTGLMSISTMSTSYRIGSYADSVERRLFLLSEELTLLRPALLPLSEYSELKPELGNEGTVPCVHSFRGGAGRRV